MSYLAIYGAARFGLEFLRGDELRGFWFGGAVSTSQVISLAAIAVAAAGWFALRPHAGVRRAKAANEK